jgi:acetate kinase
MSRRITVVNVGASTLKLALMEADAGGIRELYRAEHDWPGGESAQSLKTILEGFAEQPDAFGYRVVHGGSGFVEPAIVTAKVEAELDALVPLAPLHNGPTLAAMREARKLYPQIPGVAVFDTAFHADRPAESMQYALPTDLVRTFGFRRYGFHGIAHASLVDSLAEAQGLPVADVSAVTLQLGAGCSACAVETGRSVETSMGFTPLEGLVMMTRSGDVDPAILVCLMRAGYSADRIESELTRRSGLFGLCGAKDMREILAAESRGEIDARSAVRLFCHRVILAAGAYFTLLKGEGALVFGGGIGTHSPEIRERVARGLTAWGIVLDQARNERNEPGRISRDDSRPGFVFRTDEEAVIAREVERQLDQGS